jgi:hypothetical protein
MTLQRPGPLVGPLSFWQAMPTGEPVVQILARWFHFSGFMLPQSVSNAARQEQRCHAAFQE